MRRLFSGAGECAEYVISALAFSDGHIIQGEDAVVGGIAATAGSYGGYHFHPYNFQTGAEDLVIEIDGRLQTIVIATNIVDVDCALDALVGLTGAHASIHDGQIKISSNSTGAHSSVSVSHSSGTHAQALFYDVCEEFEGSHADVVHGTVTPLVNGHNTFGSCSPGGLSTYSFDVSVAMADSGFRNCTAQSPPQLDYQGHL